MIDSQWHEQVDEVIERALAEDVGDGDHTTLSTIPASAKGKARLLVKQDGILAGVEIARIASTEYIFGKCGLVSSHPLLAHFRHGCDSIKCYINDI